jgi:uncharacterized protein (DUF433 family)
MSNWQPGAYKNYKWIVADPQLLGGKLAIRGTRLAVSLILECLANGMTLEDIEQSFDGAFPREALPEVLKVAAEFTHSSMWLLDANMDVHLVSVLTGFNIPCDTAGKRGWNALSNGDLVRAAVDAGFDSLLTRDQLFGESASRALKLFPHFAVVVVNVPQQPWAEYREQFVARWTERPIEPVAGQLIYWP